MPDVRLDVPVEIWEAWRNAAAPIGISIPAWCKMQIHENLRRKVEQENPLRCVETPTAPMQEPTQGVLPTFIRDRIVEALEPCGGMIHEADVPKLAAKLGLKSRSVFASLGSMVGSGRATHGDRVYKLVETQGPLPGRW